MKAERKGKLSKSNLFLWCMCAIFICGGCQLANNVMRGSIRENGSGESPPPPLVFSYSAEPVYFKGESLNLNPMVSSGTGVSWSIAPDLPAGLVFDSSTGQISGTPSAYLNEQTFQVTAQDESQNLVSATFSLILGQRLVVDILADSSQDNNPGDGLCDDGSSQCSLRTAMTEAEGLGDVYSKIELSSGVYSVSGSAIAIGDGNIHVYGLGPTLTEVSGGGTIQILNATGTTELSAEGVAFTNGNSGGVSGGALYFFGKKLELRRCRFSNNAGHWGGAINTVYVENILVDECTFENNSTIDVSWGSGGALRMQTISSDAQAIIQNSTFTSNTAHSVGGAIELGGPTEFILTGNVYDQNHALGGGGTNGGAIHVFSSGASASIEITDSIFTSNTAVGSGGAVSIEDDALQVVIARNLFRDNSSNQGGALHLVSDDDILVENSTFFENIAANYGGAIYAPAYLGEKPTLSHLTFHNNSAPTIGGHVRSGDIIVQNSIFSTTASGDGCTWGPTDLVSMGGNLDVGTTCGFGATGAPNDADSVTLNLGSLADNGGPSLTIRPQAGSPAIDNGVSSVCAAKDQRNISRPLGNSCDSGAVEAE
ncbi:MAG: putative Ig domain-containing protein [Pseudobdellovibrionaceae bacterium]|nr:putative Ig domain-containing protein [Bdellovibrionales bacterium]USN47963.1 MAG: putative Ig domain-containing protein [Pseudobdellovibrionaceae bacterium]